MQSPKEIKEMSMFKDFSFSELWNGECNEYNYYVNRTVFRYDTIEVSGFEGAIRGMREPMNSHSKSDSCETAYWDEKWDAWNDCRFILGENDLDLCQRLIHANSAEHRKFLRMIHVQVEIRNPRYWWEEMATYKIGTTFNSQSTMHKLLNNKDEITLLDFAYNKDLCEYYSNVIERLNKLRLQYLSSPSSDLLLEAKQILPEGYLQARVVDFNYEVIRNICMQRKNHRLPEWAEFIKWARTLPYADELIFYKKGDDETKNTKKEDNVNGKI